MPVLSIPNFHIHEKIYESSKSKIYRAIRESDRQAVILKTLVDEYPSPEQLARFRQEYEIIRHLRVKGVIEAYSLEHHQQQWVMVLEDMGGLSLEQYLTQNQSLNIEKFLTIATELADILAQVHQWHVIHKDINPANILYNPNTGRIKLIDFGISTLFSQETTSFSNPNVLEGTRAYISPEQTGRMNRVLDYRSDFYSLGVTFYEMLTGQLPFPLSDPMELIHCHIARQPPPPHEIDSSIPLPISAIIMKLLAKNAEDRYQSAWGIQADLVFCLMQLDANDEIEAITPGENDISHKFQIPQKLYGRQAEVDALIATLNRVSQGRCEFMLVSGEPGIGKTSLVQEIYKPLTRQHGFFIACRFTQQSQGIAYQTLLQAFHELVKQLLSESEAHIQQWRKQLLAALGNNAQVIIEVIPELELIIGQQPEVPQLSANEAQNRFALMLQRFIRVFTQPAHPLVIFMDDLDWADDASLQLMQMLMTSSESHHLFLIGACRDSQISLDHNLMVALKTMQDKGAIVRLISLAPLKLSEVKQLVFDTLSCNEAQGGTLAQVVYSKTGGNPFFINEFLKSIYAEKLLRFDLQSLTWEWDLEQIQARSMTANVVELMADKVQKLPQATQAILKLAACIGSQFDLHTLAMLAEQSLNMTEVDLWDAIDNGLVQKTGEGYVTVSAKHIMTLSDQNYTMPGGEGELAYALTSQFCFVHERIQQAIYMLMEQDYQQQIHVRLGLLLFNSIPITKRDNYIFEIVEHLNLGAEYIDKQLKPRELAQLNLKAGQKAKLAASYTLAFNYLFQGIRLLPLDSWQLCYSLTLNLHLEAAEVACLKADFAQMHQLLAQILLHSTNLLDQIKAYEIQIQGLISEGNPLEAINTAIQVLKLLKIKCPRKVNKLAVKWQFLNIRLLLSRYSILELQQLPSMTDPQKLAAMTIISKVMPAVYLSDPELYAFLVCKHINLSVYYGNSPTSSHAYASYGLVLCSLGYLGAGYQYGQLALNLLERDSRTEPLERALRPKVLLITNGFIRHWCEPLSNAIRGLHEGYQYGLEIGDLEFASYCATLHTYYNLFAGNELKQLAQQATLYLDALDNRKPSYLSRSNEVFQQLVLNLQGTTDELLISMAQTTNVDNPYPQNTVPNPCVLRGSAFDEDELPSRPLHPYDRIFIYHYHVIKLMLYYWFDQPAPALKHAQAAQYYSHYLTGLYHEVILDFYTSLASLACYSNASYSQRKQLLKTVTKNQKRMRSWVKYAPMNHIPHYYLVEAERAKVLGRADSAREYYHKTINLLQEQEITQLSALAYELTAKFYLGRNQEKVAFVYLNDAHHAYRQWGAKVKAQHLEQRYPQAFPQPAAFTTTTTTSTASMAESDIAMLDLNTVLKSSQAISEEIVLPNLLEKMMEIVIENAGAEQGFLILRRQKQWLIEAEAAVQKDKVAVLQSLPIEQAEHMLSFNLINYVARTQQAIVLHNAPEEGDFVLDPYIVNHRPKSVLCTPLLNRGKTTGILYLENNLTTGAFTPARLELLNLLSAQMAISIENASLYANLEEKVKERTRKIESQKEQLSTTLEQLQSTQQQLVESEKMAALGNLVAGVAHEINTPVGVGVTAASRIVSLTQDLRQVYEQKAMKRSDLEKYLNSMTEGGEVTLKNLQRAAELIQSFKQVAVDQSSEQARSFMLQAYLNEILTSLHPAMKRSKHEVKLNCPETIILDSYPGAFSQIITNFIMNSLIHGFKDKEDGHITITAEVQGERLLFTYSDDGVGIPNVHLKSIFEPFFTTNRQDGGSGLGLHIVYNLVTHKLGGTIRCESQVGQGVSFLLELPL